MCQTKANLLLISITLIVMVVEFSSVGCNESTSDNSEKRIIHKNKRNSDLLSFKMFDTASSTEFNPQADSYKEDKPKRRRNRNHNGRRRAFGNGNRRKHSQAVLEDGSSDLMSKARASFAMLKSSPVQTNLGHISSFKSFKANKCQRVPFVQRIARPGCAPKRRQNAYCRGYCQSLYIPNSKSNNSSLPFISCSSCAPSKYIWMNVRLRCKLPEFNQTPVDFEADTNTDSTDDDSKLNELRKRRQTETATGSARDFRFKLKSGGFHYQTVSVQIISECRCGVDGHA